VSVWFASSTLKITIFFMYFSKSTTNTSVYSTHSLVSVQEKRWLSVIYRNVFQYIKFRLKYVE